MNKLHSDVGPEIAQERKEKSEKGDGKAKSFSKWLLAPGCAALLALSAHGCGDMNVDVPVPTIPPVQQQDGGATDSDTGHDTGPDADMDADTDTDSGSDAGSDADADGGCVAPVPVCTPQTVSALIHAGGAPLVVGDYRVALELTYESESEQMAIVDLDDVCDVPVVNDQIIAENATVTMVAVPGAIVVDTKAEQVAIGDQSARITATMRCLGGETDGGVTDGGTDADADTDMDSGADADTDVDSGTDADVDADVDIDSGTTDGGVTDGGTDGGVTDGGVSDGGTDAGPAACVTAGVGDFSGVINSSTPQTVGGYVFEYQGKSGINALFRISCGGSVVQDTLVCPLGSDTVKVVDSDNRTITVSPIAAGASVVNTSIHVVETH